MTQHDLREVYPLSKTKNIRGTRRLAREKAMQVIIAYSVCETDLDQLINHIFFREFNFEQEELEKPEKLLRPDEIYELEADIPLTWKEENLVFGKELINGALKNYEATEKLIEEFAKNWELERIAPIDKTLLVLAATELMNFPDIPPKVSINEALDIAKKYSTDKSKTFINGVLDAMLDKFKKEGKLNKTGRGLQEK